jgi:16S rRNA processing protein RimM
MPHRDLEPREGYVAVGRVVRPWGLRGDLKIEPLTDFPEDRFAPDASLWLDGVKRTVEHARSQKGALYVKLSGIDDATAAEACRGLLLEVPEASLPPLEDDEYYHHQLVGLGVVTTDGAELGTVTEVLPTGGNPVLLVRGDAGEVTLPFIDDVIKTVDLEAGRVSVELMEGLLPEPKAERRRFVPRRYRPRAARPS